MKYAIIETGGKQYKVTEGAKIRIEQVPGVEGQTIEFTRVLFVSDAGEPRIGQPLVQATVAGEILKNDRDDKILVFKKKRRKGFSKKFGHRQPYTEVVIKEISA